MDGLISDKEVIDARILDLIKHWKLLKFKIQQLENDKQETEKQLRELLDHPEVDGSKSYKHSNHTVRITTGLNHTLDKTQFERLKDIVKPKFNPVKEIMKYEINKKALRDCLEFGTQDDKFLQSQFIISTPKKLHIAIVEDISNEKNTDVGGDDVDAFGMLSNC